MERDRSADNRDATHVPRRSTEARPILGKTASPGFVDVAPQAAADALTRSADAGMTGPSTDTGAIAEQGKQGSPSTLPHLSLIEAAYGYDLGDVPCYTGPKARGAADALGANAYAHRGAVILGEGSDLRTVAEEAGHVLQQRGAASGGSGVTAAGSAVELEAQEAASSVAAGYPVAAPSLSLAPEMVARSEKTTAAMQTAPAAEVDPRKKQEQGYMDWMVGATRHDISQQTPNANNPRRTDTPEGTVGWCGTASSMMEVNAAMGSGGRKDLVDVGLRSMGRMGVDASHVFNVVKFGEQGGQYLADSTVEQFFGDADSKEPGVSGTHEVGKRMMQDNPELAMALRERGFAELTPDTAAAYLSAFTGKEVTDPKEKQKLFQMLAANNSPGALENDWMPPRDPNAPPESPAEYLQRAKEGQNEFYDGAAAEQKKQKPIEPTAENQKKYHNLGTPTAGSASPIPQGSSG